MVKETVGVKAVVLDVDQRHSWPWRKQDEPEEWQPDCRVAVVIFAARWLPGLCRGLLKLSFFIFSLERVGFVGHPVRPWSTCGPAMRATVGTDFCLSCGATTPSGMQ